MEPFFALVADRGFDHAGMKDIGLDRGIGQAPVQVRDGEICKCLDLC